MRRPTNMTLVLMGGGAVMLGAVGLGWHDSARACRPAQGATPNAAPQRATPDTHCDQTGSGGHGGGGSYVGSGRSADASVSARGGFGASGGVHAGE